MEELNIKQQTLETISVKHLKHDCVITKECSVTVAKIAATSLFTSALS